MTRSCQPYKDQKREYCKEREQPVPNPKAGMNLASSRNRNETNVAGDLWGWEGWYEMRSRVI